MRPKMIGSAALLLLAFVAPAGAQVRINEILANQGTAFDGGEYIELYNAGGAPVSIAGWVLTGTEFAGTCGGERHWQFPAGSTIPAGGYVVVTRDNIDTVPTETDDGFKKLFGFNADYEMYDAGRSYETDDPAVPNLTLLNGTTNDDQIRFMPGTSDYARSCSGSFNRYEALYLYNGVPGAGGVIQDVLEYDDPAYCLSDACLGIGASDNDALDVVPGVGQSIGRNAAGGDTNNSAVDFFLSTPTPKAANIPNAGPSLSNLVVNNPDPFAGETVPVTIDAVDANGIGNVYLVYAVNGGAPDSLLMANVGGNSYRATIPTQADQAHVTYFIRARDAGAPVGISKFPFFGTRQLRFGTQTIFQCQFHSPPSDTGRSAEVGRAVNIQGIVTTESGPYDVSGNVVFTVQNGTGFWNGIWVFDDFGTSSVTRGDSVRVSGTVVEFSGRTELEILGGTNVTVLASGRPLPAAFNATASQLTTGATFGELLEGVLTQVPNVTVTNPALGFGEWEISDGTGACRVNDEAFYNYIPTLGDSLDLVRGIVDYSFSDRKIEPRDNGDILGPPVVTNVRYSPVPPVSTSPVTITCTLIDNGTIPRAKLYFSTNNGATYDSTNLVNTVGTTWQAVIGPFANLTDVDYNVQVTDNDGFNGRAPAAGNYDLFVGFRTIQQVQGTFVAAGNDSSFYEGQPVNLAGIVTMAPGTIADNIFAIQNHWSTDPSYRGIQVFSGGSLVGQIELGDSVAVCGDVDEYFGLTQLRMHFTESWHDYGQVGELQGYTLSTSAFGPDSTGLLPASEPWEGVLLQFNGSTVTNALAGFGQYYIDNTVPFTGAETLVDDEGRLGGGLTYVPALSDMRTYRGLGDFTFGQYKLQPRNDHDILPFNPADATDAPVVAGVPLRFALYQNAPNPVSASGTRFAFALPRAEDVTLRVFDVQGRLVKTVAKQRFDAGRHAVEWNGTNDQGQSVSSGVYFFRLSAGKDEATRKLTFLR